MKPDPSWILVWMVALSLGIQIYATIRTFGGKRLAAGPRRPPTPTGYSVDFIDEGFEPPNEDDFAEMMGAGGAFENGES